MKTKIFGYIVLTFLAIFTSVSCQDKENVSSKHESVVNFSINVPELLNTRTAAFGENSSSERGGITNVDCVNKYDIRFQLAIYSVASDGTLHQVIAPRAKVVDTYEPVNYALRLTPNRDYKVVVWADFVTQGSTSDLHYNTSDFTNITCIDDAEHQLNDESRDAYYISKDIHITDSNINESLELRRPFAKLRIVATDWKLEGLEVPDNFKITYYGCKRFNNINIITGVSQSEDLPNPGTVSYTATINPDQKDYALNYDSSENNRTLLVDYLMTDLNDETPVHLKFEAFKGTTPVATKMISTNVPIKRNWLTTILGNILSVEANIRLTVNERFIDEWVDTDNWWNPQEVTPTRPSLDNDKYFVINNVNEFAWLPDNVHTVNGSKGVKLNADLDLKNITNFKPIGGFGDPTEQMNVPFDGQGHTIRNINISNKYGWAEKKWGGMFIKNQQIGVFGCLYGDLSNVTFENVTINGLEGSKHETGQAYYAGIVAYGYCNIRNVHVKHLFLRGKDLLFGTQNIGGLIGYAAGYSPDRMKVIENCSVEDIYLHGNTQIGGLIGSTPGFIKVSNSSANYITIQTDDKDIESGSISGFLGDIVDGKKNVIIESNCVVPKVFEVLNADGSVNTVFKQADSKNRYGECRRNAEFVQ